MKSKAKIPQIPIAESKQKLRKQYTSKISF